jgi:hypothetical protein
MKKYIAIALLMVLGTAYPAYARWSVGTAGGGAAAAPAGATFSDDFNRDSGDSLGASWTEEEGDWDIASNTVLTLATASWDYCVVKYNTPTNTVNQYAKITMGPPSDVGSVTAILLRYNNATSAYYKVSLSGYYGDVTIGKCTNIASIEECTSLATDDLGTAPLTLGVTISGTSTTTINVWANPTNATPVSATGWDSSGDTADLSGSDSSSPITTTKYIAIFGMQANANVSNYDNFTAGDIP